MSQVLPQPIQPSGNDDTSMPLQKISLHNLSMPATKNISNEFFENKIITPGWATGNKAGLGEKAAICTLLGDSAGVATVSGFKHATASARTLITQASKCINDIENLRTPAASLSKGERLAENPTVADSREGPQNKIALRRELFNEFKNEPSYERVGKIQSKIDELTKLAGSNISGIKKDNLGQKIEILKELKIEAKEVEKEFEKLESAYWEEKTHWEGERQPHSFATEDSTSRIVEGMSDNTVMAVDEAVELEPIKDLSIQSPKADSREGTQKNIALRRELFNEFKNEPSYERVGKIQNKIDELTKLANFNISGTEKDNLGQKIEILNELKIEAKEVEKEFEKLERAYWEEKTYREGTPGSSSSANSQS
ncbi:MAG: hypothetical protein JSR46_04650 [Verrucomicrobia bacterium]|nr:hypothetical protein [Verrucomicrobiota bacterium]